MQLTRRSLLQATGAAMIGGGTGKVLPPDAWVWSGTRTARRAGSRFAGDPTAGKIYFGSMVQYPMKPAEFEAQLGHGLGSRRTFFQNGQVAGLVKQVKADHVAGRFPMASIKVPDWRRVANGSEDAWLEGMLEKLAALNAPVLLSLQHEPENDIDGDGRTAASFVSMQERAIRKAGNIAPKVTVAPLLMQWTFDPGSRRNPKAWIPSNCEVFALDVYNLWATNNKVPWTQFGFMIDRARETLGNIPIAVGEYATHDDPNRAGRAATWMENAYEYALDNNIIAMNYFHRDYSDKTGEPPYALEGERLAAFRRLLRDPRSIELKA